MDEIPPKMLEASLIDESANINVEREVLSDEEEIYSGTLGNAPTYPTNVMANTS